MKLFTELETLLDVARITNLIKYSARCQCLPGVMVEAGVYRGGSLDILAKFNPDNQFYGFDSFEGLPETSEHDLHNAGEFGGIDHVALAGYFRFVRHNVRTVKGWIPKSFKLFNKHQNFAFVHIDLDLFQSILDSLDYFVPRMCEGGIIILDDFGFESTPGCKIAIDKFFENEEIKVKYRGELTYADGGFIGQYIVIK